MAASMSQCLICGKAWMAGPGPAIQQ